MNLKEEMFLKSNAGKECISYLESIQSTKITERQSAEIRNKYSMMFYNETKLGGMVDYINNSYILITLYKKYNITVVKDIPVIKIETTVCNEKKTAPTLLEGWITYIIIMIIVSIFHARILGWIFATIVFIIWRKNEIDKYN